MRKKITWLLVALSVAGLPGCLGGGGSSSTGGIYYTHSELASAFVDRMWTDVGADLELVKVYTDQYDYIVVYDHDYGTYDAYDLSYYNVGENMSDFLYYNDGSFYYDLDYIGNNYYQDPYSGVIFEESQTSKKDLMKMAALEQQLQINKSAEFIVAEYGLSETRSHEVATLALHWKNTPKESMTDADHDSFAKEVLGETISKYKDAIEKKMSGDDSDLKALLEKAADTNEGLTPERARKLFDGIFASNS